MHPLWMYRLYWKPLSGRRNLQKLWQMFVKVRMSPQLLFYHQLTRIKASLLNKSRKAYQIKNNRPQNQKTLWMLVSRHLSRKLWMLKRSWKSRTLQSDCRPAGRVSFQDSSYRKNHRRTNSFRRRHSALQKRKWER